MKYTIQLGNGTFHLSPHEIICTIALINIHYLLGWHYMEDTKGERNSYMVNIVVAIT